MRPLHSARITPHLLRLLAHMAHHWAADSQPSYDLPIYDPPAEELGATFHLFQCLEPFAAPPPRPATARDGAATAIRHAATPMRRTTQPSTTFLIAAPLLTRSSVTETRSRGAPAENQE